MVKTSTLTPLKRAATALGDELKPAGFSRHGDRFLLLPLGDFEGSVFLNAASDHLRTGCVLLYPTVGVRHRGVDDLSDRYRGRRPQNPRSATVGQPLVYLLPGPQLEGWVVDWNHEREAMSAVRSLSDAILAHGVPYMVNLAKLDAFDRALAAMAEGNDLARMKRVLVPLIAGDTQGARERLEQELRSRGPVDEADPMGIRSFAAALAKDLDVIPGHVVDEGDRSPAALARQEATAHQMNESWRKLRAHVDGTHDFQ